jgi:hypothetical protein
VQAPWFVQPDVTRIDLVWVAQDGVSHDLWIEVKRDLTIGEERGMLRSVSDVTAAVRQSPTSTATAANDPSATFDWTEYSFSRILAYTVDWSLQDDKGNKLPRTREILGQFQKDLFDLIDNAIEAHIESAQKKSAPKPTKRKRIKTSR